VRLVELAFCVLLYIQLMRYDWNLAKAKANLLKHGVDFADTVVVLEDDVAMTIKDPDYDDEDRFITLGTDSLGRLLVVVYTWRDNRIRIMSARRATRRERRDYEEGP
jgi:uncharacterized DUF497 family protein